jgi:hypothetical protein
MSTTSIKPGLTTKSGTRGIVNRKEVTDKRIALIKKNYKHTNIIKEFGGVSQHISQFSLGDS